MAAASADAPVYVENVFSITGWKGNANIQGVDTGIALADGVGAGSSTQFVGNDSIKKTSDFTGNSDGKTFTFSFWIYPTPPNNNSMRIYHTDGSWKNEIRRDSNGNLFVAFYANASSGGTVFEIQSPSVKIPINKWSHVIFSADMTDTSKRHLYINDTSASPSYTYSNTNIDFTRTTHAIGDDLTATTGSFNGYLAHFYYDRTYRDLSVTSNRRNFITADGGSTAVSTLTGLSPIVYLPMTSDYSVGENEGSGGDFTATDTPTIVTYNGTEYESGVGQGGMVWIKDRSSNYSNYLYDTERGATYQLSTNTQNAHGADLDTVTEFTSRGFVIGDDIELNTNNNKYISWTWRKCPKFFDIQTWSGDGTSGRTISHNLGSTPGMVVVKCTSAGSTYWSTWHRSIGEKYLLLDNPLAETNAGFTRTVNSTEYELGPNWPDENQSGRSYVGYFFAHNNNDGEFGLNADQDIIKCGRYDGNSNGEYNDSGTEVNLGFEPQWVMIKSATWGSGDWQIFDNVRGMCARPADNSRDGDDGVLFPNRNYTEDGGSSFIRVTPTGFKLESDGYAVNASIHDYIYVAIRRGDMEIPTDSTQVFHTRYSLHPADDFIHTGFVPDLTITRDTITASQNNFWQPRLTRQTETNQRLMWSNSTSAETATSGRIYFHDGGYTNGYYYDDNKESLTFAWKRAPHFFDVVTYNNTDASYTAVPHNLGVTPELVVLKRRTGSAAMEWYVTGHASGKYLILNDNAAEASISTTYTSHTSTHIKPIQEGHCIAYLFASLDGVSKVGTYTGTGANLTVDCGFSSGSRFVLIKRTDAQGNWLLFDVERGITTTSDDGVLELNTGNQSYTENNYASQNLISPANSGFLVPNNNRTNVSGGTYLFYAIA